MSARDDKFALFVTILPPYHTLSLLLYTDFPLILWTSSLHYITNLLQFYKNFSLASLL